MMDLAKKHGLESCGIFEKVSKTTVTGKKKWKKAKKFVQQVLDEFQEFKDPDYQPEDQNLASLLQQNAKLAKFMAWYRIDSFLKEKYLIFHEIRIRNQVMRNRGFTYLIDALNVLSLQPGAVIRLFEKKKVCKEGIYSLWLNIDGVWGQNIVDDYIPIYDDHYGKTKIFFSTPNPLHKEIWYCLLEKAMAKAYGGYKNLFHGFENYAVRDLTGAPHSMHDIPYISPDKQMKQREVDHMNDIWEKMFKSVKKGYLLSVVPRVPTNKEVIRNKNLQIPNKKYYLSEGIYSGHSYGVVTIQEVVLEQGKVVRLIKLRNPWIDEIWQGDWSQNSPLWTDRIRRKLGYPKDADNGEFWIQIKDFMNYFECLNIYKLIPSFNYNAVKVVNKDRRFMRSVVRITVPEKGKYTFSVNQKDLRHFDNRSLKYSPVKLTLGMIQKDEFKLLSHTSSTKLRNTYIRKLIDKGEYYLLIEKHGNPENTKAINSNPGLYKNLNTLIVSSYGPKTCFLKPLVDREGSDTMFDYLTYYGWKGYSKQRIGKKLTDFKINFYDGTWNNLSLYLLSIPDSIIYAFKNDHDFGVELKSEIAGIVNKEILGPDGRISFRQDFSMNPGSSDVFILRETEKLEEVIASSNKNFQIKSVVGRKYLGFKENPPTFDKVYEYLKGEKGSKKLSPIEKDKALSIKIGLFNVRTGERIKVKKTEIKSKIKRYTSPMKMAQYDDILADVEDQLVDRRSRANSEAPVTERSRASEGQGEPLKAAQDGGQGHVQGAAASPERDQRRSAAAVAQPPVNEQEAYEFKQEINVLQLGDPNKKKMRKSNGGSILKNTNKNMEQEQMNLKILEEQIRSVQDINKGDMTRLLSMKRDEVLSADNEDIKKLIKYFGLETFVSVYKADEGYLNAIATKLGGTLNINGQNQQQEEIPQVVSPRQTQQIQMENGQQKEVVITEENGVRKVREVIKQYVPLSDNMMMQLGKVPGIDMKSSQVSQMSQMTSQSQAPQPQAQQPQATSQQSTAQQSQIQAQTEELQLQKQQLALLQQQEQLNRELSEQQRLQVQLEDEINKQRMAEQEFEEQRIRKEITQKKKLLQEQMQLENAVRSGEMSQEELMQVLKLRESQGLNALQYSEPVTQEQKNIQAAIAEMQGLVQQQQHLSEQLNIQHQNLAFQVQQIEDLMAKNQLQKLEQEQKQLEAQHRALLDQQTQMNSNANLHAEQALQKQQQEQQRQLPQIQEEEMTEQEEEEEINEEGLNAYELLVLKEKRQNEKMRREMLKIISQTKQKLLHDPEMQSHPQYQQLLDKGRQQEEQREEVQDHTPAGQEQGGRHRNMIESSYTLKEANQQDYEDPEEDSYFHHFTEVITKSSKLREKTKNAIQQRIKDKLTYLRTGIKPPERPLFERKEQPQSPDPADDASNPGQPSEFQAHESEFYPKNGQGHDSRSRFEAINIQKEEIVEDNSDEALMKIHPSKMTDEEFTRALAVAPSFEEKKQLLDHRKMFFPSKDIRGSIFEAKKILETKAKLQNKQASYVNLAQNHSPRNFEDRKSNQIREEHEEEEGDVHVVPNLEIFGYDADDGEEGDNDTDEDEVQQHYFEQQQEEQELNYQDLEEDNQAFEGYNQQISGLSPYNVRASKHSGSIISDGNRSFAPIVNDLDHRRSNVERSREQNRKQFAQSNYARLPERFGEDKKDKRMSLSSMIKETTDYDLTPNLTRSRLSNLAEHPDLVEKEEPVKIRTEYYEQIMTEDGLKLVKKTKEEAEADKARLKRLQKEIKVKQLSQHQRFGAPQAQEEEKDPIDILNSPGNRSAAQSKRSSYGPKRSRKSQNSSSGYDSNSIPRVVDNFLSKDKSILRESRYIRTPNFEQERNNEMIMKESHVLEKSVVSGVDLSQKYATPLSPRMVLGQQNQAPFANKRARNTTQPTPQYSKKGKERHSFMAESNLLAPEHKFSHMDKPMFRTHNPSNLAPSKPPSQLMPSNLRQRSVDFAPSIKSKDNMAVSYIANEQRLVTPQNLDYGRNANSRNLSAQPQRKSNFMNVSNFMPITTPQNLVQSRLQQHSGRKNHMKYSSPVMSQQRNQSQIQTPMMSSSGVNNVGRSKLSSHQRFANALKSSNYSSTRNTNQIRGSNFMSRPPVAQGQPQRGQQAPDMRVLRGSNHQPGSRQMNSFRSPQKPLGKTHQYQSPQLNSNIRSMSNKRNNMSYTPAQNNQRFQSPQSRVRNGIPGQQQSRKKQNFISPSRRGVSNFMSQGQSYTSVGKDVNSRGRAGAKIKNFLSNRDIGGYGGYNKKRGGRRKKGGEKKSFVSGMIG